jgi:hypothetical protein
MAKLLKGHYTNTSPRTYWGQDGRESGQDKQAHRDSFYPVFGRISGALHRKPGYPLQFLSFACGEASGISASIPCA